MINCEINIQSLKNYLAAPRRAITRATVSRIVLKWFFMFKFIRNFVSDYKASKFLKRRNPIIWNAEEFWGINLSTELFHNN